MLRLLATLSVLVPIIVVCLFGFYRLYDSQGQARQQAERTLRVVHENAQKVLGVADALAVRSRDLVQGKSPAEIHAGAARLQDDLAGFLKDQSQIQAILIFGPDGSLVLSSRAATGKLSARERGYFKFHRAGSGDARYLSEPMIAQTSGERILSVSAAFKGPDGAFGGVVSVSVRAAYFESLYSDLATGQPGLALAAYAEDGRIYARWPPVPGLTQLDASAPFLREVANARASGFTRGVSPVDGQDRLLAYRRVGEYPLYVTAGVSLTALRMSLTKDLAVLLMLGMLPFGALWMAIRAAAKRARESAEAQRRLEEETISRRRAEEALAHSQRLETLGRVAGGVAHEFNNALMVIRTNAHLIQRSPPEKVPKRLESIFKAVESGSQLTRQLLSFTKRQALSPQSVELSTFLPGSTSLLLPILGSGVALTINVSDETPPVRVDPAELELALVNLAINARDAMPSGGTFTLTARPAGDAPSGPVVAIEAIDTGIGIPTSNLEKVFDPFFTTKGVGAGNGLGLSQVSALCERAGGVARAHSIEGKGATITLLLPVAAVAAPTNSTILGPNDGPLGNRVLLVEDDDAVAEATLGILAEMGCASSRVSNAPAALAWIEEQPVGTLDIVVSDVRMPGQFDGLGLAKRLKHSFPALPVVLITGYSESMSEIEGEGFFALAKPFAPAALRAAILRFCVPPR